MSRNTTALKCIAQCQKEFGYRGYLKKMNILVITVLRLILA